MRRNACGRAYRSGAVSVPVALSAFTRTSSTFIASALTAFTRISSTFIAFALTAFAAGCATRGSVHPDYARLAPGRICVAPVANETIHQLDEVSFGGLVQRTVLWPRSFDVTEILTGAVEESLVLRGYEVVAGCEPAGPGASSFRQPLPEGTDAPPFDAVAYLTVEEWSVDRYAASSLHLVYRVEIYRVPTADLLYAGRFRCGYSENPQDSNPDPLPVVLRRSVKSAFSSLPRRGE